jgi:hypothetical protein
MGEERRVVDEADVVDEIELVDAVCVELDAE